MAVLKDLFTKQLRLKRDDQGLRFVLEDAAMPVPAGESPAHAKAMPQDPTRLMRGELTALLDRAPGSRRVVRYLAAIERELVRRDPTGLFIFEQPIARLQKALRELDTVTGGSATRGLAALRGQLVAAIAAHETRHRETRRQAPVSSFLTDDKLQVEEVRQSDFDKASAAWLQPPPGGKAPPTR